MTNVAKFPLRTPPVQEHIHVHVSLRGPLKNCERFMTNTSVLYNPELDVCDFGLKPPIDPLYHLFADPQKMSMNITFSALKKSQAAAETPVFIVWLLALLVNSWKAPPQSFT